MAPTSDPRRLPEQGRRPRGAHAGWPCASSLPPGPSATPTTEQAIPSRHVSVKACVQVPQPELCGCDSWWRTGWLKAMRAIKHSPKKLEPHAYGEVCMLVRHETHPSHATRLSIPVLRTHPCCVTVCMHTCKHAYMNTGVGIQSCRHETPLSRRGHPPGRCAGPRQRPHPHGGPHRASPHADGAEGPTRQLLILWAHRLHSTILIYLYFF